MESDQIEELEKNSALRMRRRRLITMPRQRSFEGKMTAIHTRTSAMECGSRTSRARCWLRLHPELEDAAYLQSVLCYGLFCCVPRVTGCISRRFVGAKSMCSTNKLAFEYMLCDVDYFYSCGVCVRFNCESPRWVWFWLQPFRMRVDVFLLDNYSNDGLREA